MSNVIMLTCPQGSEEWLQARAGVITASRFADARAKLQAKSKKGGNVGDPAGVAIDYAWTIAMEMVSGKPLDNTFVSWQMRRGTELEPLARMAYESHTGKLVEEVSLLLTEDRLFGYSSDGLVEKEGMVEIKAPANCTKIGTTWENPEEAHLEYIDQINGGLWLTGRKWCDLVVYCDWLKPVGKELFIKRIYRDENEIERLEADLMEFYRMVQKNLSILKKVA